MAYSKIPKNPNKYLCEKCNYITSSKKDYNKHLLTAKHKLLTNADETGIKSQLHYCDCGKEYKHRQSLWAHKKACVLNEPTVDNTTIHQPITSMDSGLVIELLKQNQEFKELMIDQTKQLQQTQNQNNDLQKQLLEVVKDGKTVNNTINNTTNNNRFNLNVYLNETCKDAINLNDFIQSIELNINDFINTGEVGYVKGISSIMVDRILDMEPHTRPIHCTDLKRETVYVKDSDKWAKEDENKTHIRKAVRIVADKNQAQVHPWIKENPKYEILDTPECDKYFEYTKASLGGYGREEDKKFENKIINNILKETVIDKKMIE
jgi:hypothetical protein